MARAGKVVTIRSPRAAPAWHRILAPLPLFALLYLCLAALHLSLLHLPYFWDEAGYYVPAAYELFRHGSLIPSFSNAHPPLVMAWLALCWKLTGYAPLVTRLAMLAVAAFTLAGVFRLANISHEGPKGRTKGTKAAVEVALASVLCTALFPVFFAQSSLAQVDLAAAGFTLWALSFYLEDHIPAAAVLFALAGLSKETAIIAPLALIAWELTLVILRRSPDRQITRSEDWLRRCGLMLLSVLPLGLWFFYHYARTGYVFGNPEFVRYNVTATLHPLRIAAALLTRLWHLLGYMNMFVLTIAALLALRLPPLNKFSAAGNGHGGTERPRIAPASQAVLYVVIAAYLVVLSVIGGAALARYLLPVYPLVIILCVSTLRRRLPWWRAFIGVVGLGFVLGLAVNPPYRFAPEDNLDYASFVRLHRSAAQVLRSRYGNETVLTAWPASDELSKPFLGYVSRPMRVMTVDNFTAENILFARQEAGRYDVVFAFSTKYEPRLLVQLPFWERIQERYFGYHRDLPPEAIAEILGGKLVWASRSGGQWAAIISIEHVVEARR